MYAIAWYMSGATQKCMAFINRRQWKLVQGSAKTWPAKSHRHVGHILLSIIAWPYWICYVYVTQLTCMFNWSGHQLSLWPGCQRSRNTEYTATFLFYLFEKFSKWKQKTILIEEMVVLSLNLEDCDPISVVYVSFFPKGLLYHQSIFLHDFIDCFTQGDTTEKMHENNLYHICEVAIKKVKQISWQ